MLLSVTLFVQALWHFVEALWRQFDDIDSMAGALWLHLLSEAWKHCLVAAEIEISQTPGLHPCLLRTPKQTNPRKAPTFLPTCHPR